MPGTPVSRSFVMGSKQNHPLEVLCKISSPGCPERKTKHIVCLRPGTFVVQEMFLSERTSLHEPMVESHDRGPPLLSQARASWGDAEKGEANEGMESWRLVYTEL